MKWKSQSQHPNKIRLEGMESLSNAPKAASRSEGTLLRSHNIVQVVIEIFSKSKAYQNFIHRNMEWIPLGWILSCDLGLKPTLQSI